MRSSEIVMRLSLAVGLRNTGPFAAVAGLTDTWSKLASLRHVREAVGLEQIKIGSLVYESA